MHFDSEHLKCTCVGGLPTLVIVGITRHLEHRKSVWPYEDSCPDTTTIPKADLRRDWISVRHKSTDTENVDILMDSA